jgi:hypothetical protein
MKIVALLSLVALAGCIPKADAEQTPAAPVAGKCDAASVQKYLGQKFTAKLAEQIKSETGAVAMRTGFEGDPVTMDYREDRLNIFYNRDMVITVANCG